MAAIFFNFLPTGKGAHAPIDKLLLNFLLTALFKLTGLQKSGKLERGSWLVGMEMDMKKQCGVNMIQKH